MPGAGDAAVTARAALLDALEALGPHRDAVVLIGAQAIYIHTGKADIVLPAFTKDTDLAIDARVLGGDPRIERAMTKAGFVLDPVARQPGTWISRGGVPVDLMVPEALSGSPGRRGARIPPHASNAARRAIGLEAAVVDRRPHRIKALDPGDGRAFDSTSPAQRHSWSASSTNSRSGETTRAGCSTRTPTTSTGCWSRGRRTSWRMRSHGSESMGSPAP